MLDAAGGFGRRGHRRDYPSALFGGQAFKRSGSEGDTCECHIVTRHVSLSEKRGTIVCHLRLATVSLWNIMPRNEHHEELGGAR